MLIEFICNILTSNGYIQIPSDLKLDGYDFYLFFAPPSISKEEYFVVMESNVQSESSLSRILNELADQAFEEISAQENVAEYFKKNSTLIICAEEINCPTGLTLSLEEDQYNFKKNVISFTVEEIISMESKINIRNPKLFLTNKYINELINEGSGDVFRAFKSTGGAAQNYYSLLMKIVSKIPFITYIPSAKSLHDLEGAINTSMTKLQMNMYHGALEGELLDSDKKFDAWLDQP